eukprot:TRINITY_DN2975_c0_g1_i1.p1 TRINITY_DN2975_c0_g1~~TRINITY_DN2975_c0_g1_i1.p1  ORF type:complete len:327 (+),score=53.29 TRINITY_DN2975_c0_g1_i1:42-1022(+)
MSWDDLPDEIRDIILSKVDGPTLLSVCQTCKFWRDTLSDTDAWKALYSEELDKAHHDERLRAEARHAPSARQAYVVALRYNLLKPYQEHLTRYAHPTFCAAYNPYLIQQHRSYTIGNIIRALFAMWFRPQFFWALACRDAAGIVPRNSQRMIHHALIGLLLLALIPFATYYALLHSGLYIRPQPPFVTVQRYVSTDIISATFWNAVNSEHFARIYANGCTVSFVSAVALLLAWAVPYGMAAQICVHSGIWDGLVIVVPVVALTLQWFMQLQNMKYVALMLAFAVCVYVVCIITFFGVTAIVWKFCSVFCQILTFAMFCVVSVQRKS